MHIIVDVDGVLVDHIPALLKVHNAGKTDKLTRNDITDYHMLDHAVEVVYADPERVLYMPAVDRSAGAVLYELILRGHRVDIATSRPSRLWAVTVLWLMENHIPYYSVHSTSGVSKASLAGDVLIDDNPYEITACVNTGRRAIVYDQPWNRGLDFPNLFRVRDWEEIYHVIVGLWSE